MSTIDLPTKSDDHEDLFDLTLPPLDADFDFDLPCVSPRTFEAMLTAVGLQSPTPPSVSTVSSPTSSTKDSSSSVCKSVSMKSKRYRNRKREELQTLHRTVTTLEVRLAVLRARPAQVSTSYQSRLGLWQAVATRESERRQEAERENEELRKSVELQKQLAQRLDRVIQKVVARVHTRDCCSPGLAKPHSSVTLCGSH